MKEEGATAEQKREQKWLSYICRSAWAALLYGS